MGEKTPTQSPSPPSISELENQLLEKNPRVFEGLSNTRKNKLLHSLKDIISIEVRQEITQSMRYSAPVPHPDILKEYTNINPEFAQSIIQMSIDEQTYAHSRDNKVIEKSFELKKRGQIFALIIADGKKVNVTFSNMTAAAKHLQNQLKKLAPDSDEFLPRNSNS